jgi:6-phosphofructokinase 1
MALLTYSERYFGVEGILMQDSQSFTIRTLGACTLRSPLVDEALGRHQTPRFMNDGQRIRFDDRIDGAGQDAPTPVTTSAALELAGPRERIFFDPSQVSIGIVTCGGLCPGLNDVIRGLVMEAWHRYGVRRVFGFEYGYRGLAGVDHAEPLSLDPEMVSEIHEQGGSFLRSSRGPQEPAMIVDNLQRLGINILFTIGGDGTLRGALAISEEVHRRNLAISVVGIPKTIDNDIHCLDQSFGFETAFSAAVGAIKSAHNEARGTLNGIGLVKVMGRHSGFLACHAALASSHANFVIIPEMPFGDKFGIEFRDWLVDRLSRRHHAVILVAEGAGQDFLNRQQPMKDASGNAKLADIGLFLADRLKHHLDQTGMEYSLKYIDPSYMVRSVQANAADSVYCWQLAQNAVHAAMAGKTELIVGRWHGRLVHIPIAQAIACRKQVDPEGDLWLSVLETTGQPAIVG